MKLTRNILPPPVQETKAKAEPVKPTSPQPESKVKNPPVETLKTTISLDKANQQLADLNKATLVVGSFSTSQGKKVDVSPLKEPTSVIEKVRKEDKPPTTTAHPVGSPSADEITEAIERARREHELAKGDHDDLGPIDERELVELVKPPKTTAHPVRSPINTPISEGDDLGPIDESELVELEKPPNTTAHPVRPNNDEKHEAIQRKKEAIELSKNAKEAIKRAEKEARKADEKKELVKHWEEGLERAKESLKGMKGDFVDTWKAEIEKLKELLRRARREAGKASENASDWALLAELARHDAEEARKKAGLPPLTTAHGPWERYIPQF